MVERLYRDTRGFDRRSAWAMSEISVFSPAGRSPGIDGFAFHMVPGSGGIQCQLPLKRSRFDPRSRPEGVEIREMLLSTATAGKNCFNGFTVSHWQMGMRVQPQQSGMLPAPDGIYPQSACQTPLACKKLHDALWATSIPH